MNIHIGMGLLRYVKSKKKSYAKCHREILRSFG